MKLIEMNMDKIVALCKKYKVAKLWVFIYELEDLFGRKVDLTDYTAIKNKYFKEEVDRTKRLIYNEAVNDK